MSTLPALYEQLQALETTLKDLEIAMKSDFIAIAFFRPFAETMSASHFGMADDLRSMMETRFNKVTEDISMIKQNIRELLASDTELSIFNTAQTWFDFDDTDAKLMPAYFDSSEKFLVGICTSINWVVFEHKANDRLPVFLIGTEPVTVCDIANIMQQIDTAGLTPSIVNNLVIVIKHL